MRIVRIEWILLCRYNEVAVSGIMKTNWKHLFIAILVCEGAGIIGSAFTVSAIPTWYATLVKPSFNPPGWVFGPVWTTLYALMGMSLYRIYRLGFHKERVYQALVVFGIQLVLNALWSIIFFGLHSISGALVEIMLLLGFIFATMVRFAKLDRIAAYLLLPYLLWVSFATFLTYSIWELND